MFVVKKQVQFSDCCFFKFSGKPERPLPLNKEPNNRQASELDNHELIACNSEVMARTPSVGFVV
jgi:hypothetical protein